jgi:hypothetical protein
LDKSHQEKMLAAAPRRDFVPDDVTSGLRIDALDKDRVGEDLDEALEEAIWLLAGELADPASELGEGTGEHESDKNSIVNSFSRECCAGIGREKHPGGRPVHIIRRIGTFAIASSGGFRSLLSVDPVRFGLTATQETTSRVGTPNRRNNANVAGFGVHG